MAQRKASMESRDEAGMMPHRRASGASERCHASNGEEYADINKKTCLLTKYKSGC